MQATLAPVQQTDAGTEDTQAKFRVWNYPIREQYNIINDNLKLVSTPQEGIEKVNTTNN
jgi:hypothetical protein